MLKYRKGGGCSSEWKAVLKFPTNQLYVEFLPHRRSTTIQPVFFINNSHCQWQQCAVGEPKFGIYDNEVVDSKFLFA